MTMMNDYYHPGIPNGWSALGGQTKSPHDPIKDPGGSSTGSAVSLVAGLTAAALGVETMGSIVRLSSAYPDDPGSCSVCLGLVLMLMRCR